MHTTEAEWNGVDFCSPLGAGMTILGAARAAVATDFLEKNAMSNPTRFYEPLPSENAALDDRAARAAFQQANAAQNERPHDSLAEHVAVILVSDEDRKLSRLSNWHQRDCSDGTRLQSGAKIRSRDCNPG
jgi:hypothetical protein